MNFFKMYIGDYQRDTAHLSVTEHGAYMLMLQHYYATEKPLPTGKALHRMLRAQDKSERDAIDSVAAQFWIESPQGLVNERAVEELVKAGAQAETNRRIAVAREQARRDARKEHGSCSAGLGDRQQSDQKSVENSAKKRAKSARTLSALNSTEVGQVVDLIGGVGHESCTNRSTNDQPNQTPDTRHTTTTVVPVGEVVGCGEEDAVADKPRRPASQGTRLPADWTPTPEDIAYLRAKRPELEPLEVAAAFRDHWVAQVGAAARKADWSATWRNWVRRERSPAPRVNGKHNDRQRIASEIAAIARGDSNGTVIDITPRAAAPALGGPFV